MFTKNNTKLYIGITYILIITVFLWFFFNNFSFQDFKSFDLIKSNRNSLNKIKESNIILSVIIFYLISILWVLLLGFASPIFLVGGFLFGKWVGTLVVVLGLTSGATLLYIFASFMFKDFIYNKFSKKYNYLFEIFKKNELLYFVIYRFIGGIPFFLQNLIPTIFNIKIKNYFFGSLIGLTPQLFIGVSLGSGIDKLIENNNEMPSVLEMIMTPDIYLPILGLFLIIFIGFIYRKKFVKE
tara:strand:- start:50 stop:769 length:720 start_codon:yes stop_codon:yes gene_type:complete